MPKIKSVRPAGRHQAYDLEVDHPDHQFYLSNGLLTSNSHSYTYTVMTMQCAHLATYHPLEFYAAVLSMGATAELQDYVSDIQKCGIKILPVDINRSGMSHTIEGESIRLSFRSVLGVGPAAIEKIVAGQPYSSWLDFLQRSGASKTSIEPLIQVGALRELVPNVRWLEDVYRKFREEPKYRNKTRGKREGSVCWDDYVALVGAGWLGAEDYPLHDLVFLENQLMGFSLRGSPFEVLERDQKIDQLFGGEVPSYDAFVNPSDDDEFRDSAMLPVALREVKEKAQKNKQMMAWLKFQTMSGEEIEAPCFSTMWQWIKGRAKRGSVYVATFNHREDDPRSLVLGPPGFGCNRTRAEEAFIDVDSITAQPAST